MSLFILWKCFHSLCSFNFYCLCCDKIFLKSERSLSTAWRECDMTTRSCPVIGGHVWSWGSFLVIGGHFRSFGVTSFCYGAISDCTSSVFWPLDMVLTTFWKKETWFSFKNGLLYAKNIKHWIITIIDWIKRKSVRQKTEARMIYHFPYRNGPLRAEMTLHACKWPLRPEMTLPWPEMTAVDVTGRPLSRAAKRSKTTVFSVFSTLTSGRKRPRGCYRLSGVRSRSENNIRSGSRSGSKLFVKTVMCAF